MINSNSNFHTTVFSFGDYGSVGVVVPIPILHQPNDSNITPHQYSDRKSENEAKVKITEVKILPTGASFGELALIEYKPRSATIICKEDCNDCTFAVLSKKNFNEILREIENQKFTSLIRFFKDISLFENWGFKDLRQFALNGTEHSFLQNHIIYKEGDQVDYIYMIKKGEFHLIMAANVSYDPEDPKNFLLQEVLQEPLTKKNICQKYQQIIAALTQGELVGEHEFIFRLKKKQHTLKCYSSEGELLRYTRKEFNDKIIKRGLGSYLKNRLISSQNFRSERLKEFKNRAYQQMIQILQKIQEKNLEFNQNEEVVRSLSHLQYYLTSGIQLNHETQGSFDENRFKKAITLDKVICCPNCNGTEDIPLDIIQEFSNLEIEARDDQSMPYLLQTLPRSKSQQEFCGDKISSYKFEMSSKNRRPTISFINKDQIQLKSTSGNEMNLLNKFEIQEQVPLQKIVEMYAIENSKKERIIKQKKTTNAQLIRKNAMESDPQSLERFKTMEEFCRHIAILKVQKGIKICYRSYKNYRKIKTDEYKSIKNDQLIQTKLKRNNNNKNQQVNQNIQQKLQLQSKITEDPLEKSSSLNQKLKKSFQQQQKFSDREVSEQQFHNTESIQQQTKSNRSLVLKYIQVPSEFISQIQSTQKEKENNNQNLVKQLSNAFLMRQQDFSQNFCKPYTQKQKELQLQQNLLKQYKISNCQQNYNIDNKLNIQSYLEDYQCEQIQKAQRPRSINIQENQFIPQNIRKFCSISPKQKSFRFLLNTRKQNIISYYMQSPNNKQINLQEEKSLRIEDLSRKSIQYTDINLQYFGAKHQKQSRPSTRQTASVDAAMRRNQEIRNQLQKNKNQHQQINLSGFQACLSNKNQSSSSQRKTMSGTFYRLIIQQQQVESTQQYQDYNKSNKKFILYRTIQNLKEIKNPLFSISSQHISNISLQKPIYFQQQGAISCQISNQFLKNQKVKKLQQILQNTQKQRRTNK